MPGIRPQAGLWALTYHWNEPSSASIKTVQKRASREVQSGLCLAPEWSERASKGEQPPAMLLSESLGSPKSHGIPISAILLPLAIQDPARTG